MLNFPKPINVDNLVEYVEYRPLLYNPDRKYLWNRNNLIQEGIRRFIDWGMHEVDREDLKHWVSSTI